MLTGEAEIRFRHNHYQTGEDTEVSWHIDGYEVVITPENVSLGGYSSILGVSSDKTDLVSTPVQIEPNTWHTVTIVAQENKFTVYIDAMMKLIWVDEQYNIISGYVQIQNTEGARVFYDDFSVTAPAVPTTQTP